MELTLAQTEPQQHPWLGYENATIAFGPAVSIVAIAGTVPRSVRGQFLTVMLGNSSLFATKGLVLTRFGQVSFYLTHTHTQSLPPSLPLSLSLSFSLSLSLSFSL